MSLRRRLLGARSVTAGAALYVGMRWFDRAIGVLSTIFLARLLTPDDFGVVALATVVIGFISMVLDFGVGIRIVQMPQVDNTDMDTAWTVRLIQNVLVSVALVSVAPYVAEYYGDQRLRPVLQLLALGFVAGSQSSMCVVVFQKRREYAREVTFAMTKRLVTFASTLILAFQLRSYWALVYGSLLGTMFAVALSYWMYPVFRRPTLRRWRKFFGASAWLTLRSMGVYASQQVDKLFIGKVIGSQALGAYTLADQIATMPSTELLAPVNRAMFPALSQKQGKPAELRRAFLSVFAMQVMIALPASIGLALVSEQVVLVMLGEKWSSAIPLLALLALCYGFTSLSSAFGYLLLAAGKFRSQAAVNWFNCGLLIVLLVWAGDSLSAESAATIRIGVAAIFAVALIGLSIVGVRTISARDCGSAAWRPVLATAVMAICVEGVATAGAGSAPLLLFIEKVCAGAIAYCMALAILWAAVGKPDGAESWALGFIRKALQRLSLIR